MSTFVTQPFAPQSFNQILQTLISYMAAQSNVTDANIGSVNRTFFESISLVLDNAYFQLVNVLNAYYINTATGTDLDRRGTDFNLQRFLNTSAVVDLVFTGVVSTPIPPGTIAFVPASGNTPEIDFITTGPGFVGFSTQAICTTTGSIGNVPAGSIVNIQNNPNPSLITGVSNPAASVGGFDVESDSAYRTRLINYLTSLSQGTVAAIVSGLMNIPSAGITQVQVLQINLSPSNPGGPTLGYSLDFTAPYTNVNTDLQGTILNPASTTVRLATTGALATNTYNNGASGVGATLTATSNGLLSVDGLAVATNDRILVKNEATASHNGVYSVVQPGDGSTPYVLIRVNDLNTPAQFLNYSTTVLFGNTLAGDAFIQTNSSFTAVGTSAANFSLIHEVTLATVAPLFPANTYNNGAAGVGATLTANANGVLTVDGVNANTLNQRILVKNEATPANNGVYSLTTVGTPSVPYVLTRVTDLNTPSQFPFYTTAVTGGQTLIASTWIQTTSPFNTVGTDPVVFTEVTGILASLQTNTPGSMVIVIDNGSASLPFSSVTAALNAIYPPSGTYPAFPGLVSAGVQAFVTRPEIFLQPITLTIVVNPNFILDQTQVVQNVKTALTTYFTTLPLGATIYRSEIIDVVMNVTGVLNVPEASFVTPASDTTVGVATRALPGILVINS